MEFSVYKMYTFILLLFQYKRIITICLLKDDLISKISVLCWCICSQCRKTCTKNLFRFSLTNYFHKTIMDYAQIINKLSIWFDNYAHSFKSGPQELNEAVLLKHEHTKRVCSNMDSLCKSISLENSLLFSARITALFHDVGRFQQYKDHGTFQDRKSVNHSQLGLKIIDENHLFDDFPQDLSQKIRTAILYHSARSIPDNLTKDQDLLCRLIRDADKLDIYSIAASYYNNPSQAQKEIFETGIPDLPTVSPQICSAVANGLTVDFSMIRCLNDFKLIQVGWVYDLNFTRSFQLIKERGHFDQITAQLPHIPEVVYAVELARKYLESKASESLTAYRLQ